jgi:hypothetical protein
MFSGQRHLIRTSLTKLRGNGNTNEQATEQCTMALSSSTHPPFSQSEDFILRARSHCLLLSDHTHNMETIRAKCEQKVLNAEAIEINKEII